MSAATAPGRAGTAGGALARAGRALRLVWSSREGKIGLSLLVFVTALIVFGPLLAPYDPLEIGVAVPNSGPSLDHPFGADKLGRDVFSRVLCGGRSVVVVPLIATTVAFLTGGMLGIWAATVRGRGDTIVSRVLDVMLALPPLLLVLVVATTAGRSSVILAACVAVVFAPRVARVLRGATLPISQREFVQAARARGERGFSIVVRELLPNITPTLFVEFASRLSFAVTFIATLNFLGLGVQPPSPNWAVMVAENRTTIDLNPIATLAPAIAIGLVAVAVGMIADAVTQAYDVDRGKSGPLL